MFAMTKSGGCLTAVLLVLAVSVLTFSTVNAADKEQTNTVMAMSEMCSGCVKKITKRFEGVEGIAKVTCSIEDKSVTVIPTHGVRLSPKGIWEIMEEIGKTPTKMVSPDGTFTSKPQV